MTLVSRRSPEQTGVLPPPQPYLPSEPAHRVSSVEGQPSPASVGVRAYLMTGGRASAPLAYETMLGPGPVATSADVRFERAAILACCQTQPLSVAEISAYLCVPIGVVRVLAADLLDEHLLVAYGVPADSSDDITLLTKLIAGVRAL